MSEATQDPYALFQSWYAEAVPKEPNDPNAMALATVGPDGQPSVRMVLLKELDTRGFVFYTNLESRKGREALAHPKASLCFHWKSLQRQVRVDGPVERVTEAEADAYFATRPRLSQVGAWASVQSRPLASREELEARVKEFEARFPGEVPRPPHWSGLRVLPLAMEFWEARPFRLHHRLLFTRPGLESGWSTQVLFP